MEKEQQSNFTILMFPWLAHGHIFPFLELAKKLSHRNFNIYLCSTAINLDSIRTSMEKDIHVDCSIKLVELQIPETPDELPPHLHTTKNLPPHLLPVLIQALQKSSSSFIDIFNSVKPDLLIYDFFQPWAAKYALSQGIPAVYFSTSGAAMFSYYHHSYTFETSSPFPYQAIYLLDQEKINHRAKIGSLLKDADDNSFGYGIFKMSSDIILAKSSCVVEKKYIDYLSVLCKKKIVTTGPLIVDDHNEFEEEHSEIMQWLNGKPPCSTVYVSFGSECFLSKEQIGEIAKGLELCNTNFIWIIRFPDGEKIVSTKDVLPQGFLERVNERGIVVKNWAPQTKILKHPSIGGFVSHCGWSSIMESMHYSVPIIGMPMRVDQPINARLIVEQGAGVEVRKETNGQYLSGEIAKAIDKVMVDKPFCEDLRDRARDLSKKMKHKEEDEVNEATEELIRLCMKNKKQQV